MPSIVVQHKKINGVRNGMFFLSQLQQQSASEKLYLPKNNVDCVICLVKYFFFYVHQFVISVSFAGQNGSVSIKIFSTMGGGGTMSSSFR